MARVVNVLNGMDHVPGATLTRYCASSVQTTRMAFHAIKAGEGDVFVSAGVETVSRYARGTSDHWPDTNNPQFDDAEGPHREDRRGRHRLARPARGRRSSPTSTSPWARPPRTSPGCAASSRQELDEFGVRSQNLAEKAIADGFWEREITPVTTPDGTEVGKDDGPRAGVTSRRSRSSSRSSGPTASSPPATAARSTTAPPRS